MTKVSAAPGSTAAATDAFDADCLPPAGVNLTALLNRLPTACDISLVAIDFDGGQCQGDVSLPELPFRVASCHRLTTCTSQGARAVGVRLSSSEPKHLAVEQGQVIEKRLHALDLGIQAIEQVVTQSVFVGANGQRMGRADGTEWTAQFMYKVGEQPLAGIFKGAQPLRQRIHRLVERVHLAEIVRRERCKRLTVGNALERTGYLVERARRGAARAQHPAESPARRG